jgi:hypothetical protein
MKFTLKIIGLWLCLYLVSIKGFSQSDEHTEQDSSSIVTVNPNQKTFHAGVYVGAFWANHSTAGLYDGYGFDEFGVRNTFANSILYNQIVNIYGGGYGGVDLIAQLLNVEHKDWYFNEQNMPANLRYTTTYMVGLNTRYQVDKKTNIIFNINASKLVVDGKFTISSTTTSNGFQSQAKQNQFTITGAEQRMMMQLGYQKIIGKNEKLKLMVEGGLNIIFSKAQKNMIYLNSDLFNGANNISVDLMNIYNQVPYSYYSPKYLVGAGIGAFAGAGLHLTINPKYTVQLLYSPSYDRISIGYNPKFKLQNGFGLRFYYNLSQ